MSIERLLERLDRVRQVGRDQWRAPCPAHGGRNPSTLSIRGTDDGVILLHCYAGCDAQAVVEAVGMTLADLFPPRESNGGPQFRRASRDWRGVVALVRHELLVMSIGLEDISAGKPLSDDDARALQRAARHLLRIERIIDA